MNSAWALESHLRVLIDTVWKYITKEGVDPRISTMKTDIINHVMGFKIVELHHHLLSIPDEDIPNLNFHQLNRIFCRFNLINSNIAAQMAIEAQLGHLERLFVGVNCHEMYHDAGSAIKAVILLRTITMYVTAFDSIVSSNRTLCTQLFLPTLAVHGALPRPRKRNFDGLLLIK